MSKERIRPETFKSAGRFVFGQAGTDVNFLPINDGDSRQRMGGCGIRLRCGLSLHHVSGRKAARKLPSELQYGAKVSSVTRSELGESMRRMSGFVLERVGLGLCPCRPRDENASRIS